MFQIEISIAKQQLILWQNNSVLKTYPISSGLKGVGEERGSFQTPRGWHVIRAKIGTGVPVNTVFVARRPTGEIYSPEFKASCNERDWILTRILWLSGLEVNKNRLGSVDTMRRYIYIHGTPDDTLMGVIGSRGCIRMRNDDIVALFDQVPTGTKVLINE